MVTAIVLIKAARQAINDLADKLLAIKGVAEVYSVAGEFDFVVVLRVASYEELAPVVTDQLATLDGLTRTQTLMAFRLHSRHDLDRMWNIGEDADVGSLPAPLDRGHLPSADDLEELGDRVDARPPGVTPRD